MRMRIEWAEAYTDADTVELEHLCMLSLADKLFCQIFKHGERL